MATTSPRRIELAGQMGLEFEATRSDYEEDMTLDLPPARLAEELARGKAHGVREEGIIIGVDTFITHDGRVLGKPRDENQAKKMLQSFSGKEIEVYSGLCIYDSASKEERITHHRSLIKMAEISEDEIDGYVATGEPMDKAGAFGIQGLGSVFIERIEGSYSSIVGLPIHEIYKILKEMGQWRRAR